MIRRKILSAVVLSLSFVGGFGQAVGYEARTGAQAVVELFTSQGCTRCPPADAYLAELGRREGIVALAYHIDYWDYVGWEDTFALPANTELQKAYAASWGKNRVYTPQMVVNGAHGMVGSQRGEVEAALANGSLALALGLNIEGDELARLAVPGQTGLGASIVWLVTYRDAAEVPIARGENSGRVLHYSHIVTGRQAIGMWNPQTGAEITIPLEAALGQNDGAVILVQEKKGDLPGRVLGAAVIKR
jgi:hypothetical protein